MVTDPPPGGPPEAQQWLGVCNMKEADWGWMTQDENLVPVMTDLPPAPDELLRVIRCNCTTDFSTTRCSCRNHSLEWSPASGQCRGIGCSNSTAADISDEDDDDDADLYLNRVKVVQWLDYRFNIIHNV